MKPGKAFLNSEQARLLIHKKFDLKDLEEGKMIHFTPYQKIIHAKYISLLKTNEKKMAKLEDWDFFHASHNDLITHIVLMYIVELNREGEEEKAFSLMKKENKRLQKTISEYSKKPVQELDYFDHHAILSEYMDEEMIPERLNPYYPEIIQSDKVSYQFLKRKHDQK